MAALLLPVSMSMNVNTAAKLVNATAAGVVIHLQLCLTNILQNYKYLTAAGYYNLNSFPQPHIFVPTAAGWTPLGKGHRRQRQGSSWGLLGKV